MKRRLPIDIDFLLEGVINENPDSIRYDDTFLSWMDSNHEPWAFMTFKTFSVIGLSYTHWQIVDVLLQVRSRKAAKSWLQFYIRGRTTFKVSDVDALIKEVKDPTTPLGEYLKSRGLKRQSGDASIYRSKFGLSGRIWAKKNMMSFWNTKEQVIKEFSSLEKLFKDFPKELGNMNDYQIDWIERTYDNSMPLTPMSSITKTNEKEKQGSFLNTLFGSPQDIPKLTPEQLRMIQQKVHTLPPEKKKQALQIMGVKNVKAAEIAAKLGMTVAEFNHLMQINESETITETPDKVYDTTGKKIAGWYDGIAFYIFDTVAFLCPNGTHYEIMKNLYYAWGTIEVGGTPESYIRNSEDVVVVSNWQNLDKEIRDPNSGLGKMMLYIKAECDRLNKPLDGLPDEVYENVRTDFGIAGRAWPSEYLISFWNDRKTVIKKWEKVEFLFKEFPSYLYKLDYYSVDGVERDEESFEEDMLSAKAITQTVKTGGKSSGNNKQMQFIAKLFSEPDSIRPLKDSEKKAARKAIHTLPPEQKKKALMIMGAKNVKAIEIAEKLGMTVAEFNHIMQINEDVMPKLGDIIKEIQ